MYAFAFGSWYIYILRKCLGHCSPYSDVSVDISEIYAMSMELCDETNQQMHLKIHSNDMHQMCLNTVWEVTCQVYIQWLPRKLNAKYVNLLRKNVLVLSVKTFIATVCACVCVYICAYAVSCKVCIRTVRPLHVVWYSNYSYCVLLWCVSTAESVNTGIIILYQFLYQLRHTFVSIRVIERIIWVLVSRWGIQYILLV